jgi:hypothetical protein
MLHGLLVLHKEIVKLPENRTPDAIINNLKALYFMDVLGALDGIHLLVYILDTEPWKLCFQN